MSIFPVRDVSVYKQRTWQNYERLELFTEQYSSHLRVLSVQARLCLLITEIYLVS